MGTKVTSSSGSVLKEPEIQKLQMQAKIFRENSLNELNALKSTTQLLDIQSIWYQQAFSRLFGDSFRTFEFQLSQHMNNLETLLNAETLHEMDSKSALSVIKAMKQSSGIVNQINRLLNRNRDGTLQLHGKVQEVYLRNPRSTSQPLEHFDQNAAECVDERAALANLIANLTHDTEENKTIQKQLKKANASLTQELKECKTNLDETSRALGEATSSRDSSLIALQTKQRLELRIVNQKHDELAKKSLLTRSQFEGQLKEKSKVISDLKVKEGKDIDTMIEMDKQIKFLNEILYKRNQSIQTIHMLAPKCATYHGRSTFANPKYCKKAQSDKPCLYEIPYDTSDLQTEFAPMGNDDQNKDAKSSSKTNKEIMPVEKSVHLRTRKDRIFTGIGWVPIVKLLKLLPGKVENEPTLVQMRYLQSYFLHAKNLEFSARIGIQDHSNEQSSSKLVPKLFLKQQGQLHHGKSGLLLHLHIAMM
ncbi:hypothetical protein Tco_0004366 [Tanacetum coccineum]